MSRRLSLPGGTVELGDVTVLLGPPGAGKSRALRALYASLLPGDRFVAWRVASEAVESIGLRDRLAGSLVAAVVLASGDGGLAEEAGVVLRRLGAEAHVEHAGDRTTLRVKARWRVDGFGPAVRERVETYRSVAFPERAWPVKPADLAPSAVAAFSKPVTVEAGSAGSWKARLSATVRADGWSLLVELGAVLEADYGTLARDAESVAHALAELGPGGDPARKARGASAGALFVRDCEPAVADLHRELSSRLAKAVARSAGVPDVLFLPSGRGGFVQLLGLVDPGEAGDPVLYSYLSRLQAGVSALGEAEASLWPTLRGTARLEDGAVVYRPASGSEVPAEHASAEARETIGLAAPLLTAPPGSLVIVEEPESGMSYSGQILTALSLVAQAKKFGHAVVLSTHSDVLATALAYLAVLEPTADSVEKLVAELTGGARHAELARTVAVGGRPSIRFYYFEPRGGEVAVSEKRPEEIIRGVPGASDAIDALAEWALSEKWVTRWAEPAPASR